ncbi:MAG: tol-pal system YbgF family protein, partial [Mangrovibacterium sp.]
VFEAQMEVQPELHAELLLHQEINQAIRENDVMELRVRLDNIREESRGIRQKERSLFQRLPRKKLAATAVAASLLLLIGISGILRHDMPATPEKLYQNYYTPYPGTGISRSVTESADRAINTGMLRFNEGNYEEALKQFSLVLEQKEKDPVALFYSGMSFQAIGSYEKAIASYCRVGRGNLFTDQAEWYTGLCYLQLEDRGKAYALFSMIASGKGYYHKQAEAILRKMRYKP